MFMMGVSGSGKTDVGKALAQILSWDFVDGDAFHPPANVAKMRGGTPLTDDDRWPWLDSINLACRERRLAGLPTIFACSALKQAYRDRLSFGLSSAVFVHLKVDAALIQQRLAKGRPGHFMPPALLGSQFQTLEEPIDGITIVDTGDTPAVVASRIVVELKNQQIF